MENDECLHSLNANIRESVGNSSLYTFEFSKASRVFTSANVNKNLLTK